ncbi:hypothetical protein [Dinoroseobacter sp. S124A]|uniref:hypothetical protein n=1 Tax=Dinoroseobacter sp. S124A TaxID=3415128 RepID=UPI003C7C627F
MSSKFIIFVLGVALVVFCAYVFRDRIPSPTVSAKRPYSAPNGHKVAPLEQGPEQFEVWDRPGAIGRDYFCAAAKYAEAVLRAEPTDHLRVTTAFGPSQVRDNRRAVGFELVCAAELSDSTAPNNRAPVIDQPGESRSILVSRRFCA